MEVEIKLSDYPELLTDVNGTYPVSGVNIDNTIDASLATELVFTDTKLLEDQSYIITEIQENVFQMNTDEETFLLDFKNPIKELYFVVQREGVSPFDYDNSLNFIDDTYILFENLKTLELILDDQIILSKKTGNTRFLKAVQGYLHHTRTQIIRRFYSYSFALKPEEWYPTGQVNFSHIKNQILKVNLNRCDPQVPRYLKVYALSYNILNLKDGCIKKMY
jgi:frataxin-like iron-binding protein CyaY